MRTTALIITLFLLATAFSDYEPQDCYGDMYIHNVADGETNPLSLWCRVIRGFGGYTDGFDSGEDELMDFDFWNSDDYIAITSRLNSRPFPHIQLSRDMRAVDNNGGDVYSMDLFVNDNPRESYLNAVLVEIFDLENYYGCKAFGNYLVFLSSKRFLYGEFVNIRKLVENFNPYNSPDYTYPHIHLQNITPFDKRYPQSYETMKLYITPNWPLRLFDFDNNGKVNFKDFSVMADSWLKPVGKYRADVSGVDGVPDGVVDSYDLDLIAEAWADGIFQRSHFCDLNGDGKIDLRDYLLIANDWLMPRGDYLTDIDSDGFVDDYDLQEWMNGLE